MAQADASIAGAVEQSRTGSAAAALLRTIAGLVLAALSGVLATLAFPPFEFWPLIFVAFVPMVFAQHRIMPAALAPLAPGMGLGVYFAGQLSSGLADGNVAWYIQMWPVYVGLFIALLCWFGRGFHARTHYLWLPITFPLAWTAVDAARAFSGVDVLAGTWASPVYALYSQPWFLQPLSVFGLFGLELLVLVINYALATLLIALIDTARAPQTKPRVGLRAALIATAVTALVTAGWTALSLAQFGNRPADLRMAAVMSNGAIDSDADLQRMMELTRQLGRDGAQIVVWHEGGLRFDPLVEHTDELRALARDSGAHVAVGYGVRDPDGTRRNESVVFAPSGEVFGPYGKSHPGRFAGDQSDTGGNYNVYETALGRLSTIICYDLDFTDTAREMARRGAEFIAVPSNDVPAIASTHYTHLVFRAIENRLPMAKADSLFDIAVIDPYGRILDRHVQNLSRDQARALYEADTLNPVAVSADVPRGTGDTLTVRFGDWMGWLAILGAAVFFLARWRWRPART